MKAHQCSLRLAVRCGLIHPVTVVFYTPQALAGPSFCAGAIGLRLLCWNNFENYRLWEKSKYFITFAHMHSIRIMDNDCEYNELSQVQEMLLWPPQTAKSRHACAWTAAACSVGCENGLRPGIFPVKPIIYQGKPIIGSSCHKENIPCVAQQDRVTNIIVYQ